MGGQHDATPGAAAGIDECAEGAGDVDCAQVFAKLDLILDRELPASELVSMEQHLTACLPCADRADFETRLRAVVRDSCASEHAPPRLMATIREALELSGD